jgi:hypothetical protein
LMWHP